MRRFSRNTQGSGYLIVIAFSIILMIFFMIMLKVRKGHAVLQSKSARDFLATTVAEAGLNCILSELRVDWAFRTHWYYRKDSDPEWRSPVKSRASNLKNMNDLVIDGVSSGIYSGRISLGTFKARFAPVFSSKEDSKTKTLRESQLYTRAEIVAHVGDGKKDGNNSYRKLTALIERRSPATENLLYDSEILDLAFGPYRQANPNVFRRGRLYGGQRITFNTSGGPDKGSEFLEMEKIESPGMIEALCNAQITFADGTSHRLNSGNDSTKPGEFKTFDGYILDGTNGAHPIKFTHLPKDRIYAMAKKYRATYGFIIEEGTLPYGEYNNPYDPSAKYVDLDFGAYCVDSPPPGTEPEVDEPDEEEEEEGGGGGGSAPAGTDDPEAFSGLPGKGKGKSLLIYSKVPLRVWGCPDRNVTIFSEKDILIAGDFNQNQDTPQDYEDANYLDYQTEIRNGHGGHKVGALLMSLQRVIIDASRPQLFVKNEIKPYFMLELAQSLHPIDDQEVHDEMYRALCPMNPDQRRGIVGLGMPGPDGLPSAKFVTIHWLYMHSNIESGPSVDFHTSDLRDFFSPGTDKPRFGINDSAARDAIIDEVIRICRLNGAINRDDFDRIFELAWKQAALEEAQEPNAGCGALGMMPWLFDEAVKSFRDGIFMPEITINATLISCARRAAKWTIGISEDKVRDEIGNSPANSNGIFEYLPQPRFLIQRVYGSEIRLSGCEPDYFMDGSYSGKNILRRRIWDPKTFKSTLYKPLEIPTTHNILTFSETLITQEEYENF